MYKNALVVILSVILSFDAYAGEHSPAFDCSFESLNKVEMLICNDDELSQKDFQINQLYILAMEKSQNKDQLKKSQKNWITKIRSKCTTIECLKSVYESQEIFLGGIAISDSKYKIKSEYRGNTTEQSCWKTNDNDTLVREMNLGFPNRDNANFTIFSCDSVWQNHTGKINSGWGGICWAEIDGKLSEYFMCSNAVTARYSPVIIRNEYLLVRFLQQECYGG